MERVIKSVESSFEFGTFNLKMIMEETIALTLVKKVKELPCCHAVVEEDEDFVLFEYNQSTWITVGCIQYDYDSKGFYGISLGGMVAVEGDDALDFTKEPNELGLDNILEVSQIMRTLLKQAGMM